MNKAIRRQRSAEHPGSPKSFWSLQSQKDSSEFAVSLKRPVPCEQGAADCYTFESSADPIVSRPGLQKLICLDWLWVMFCLILACFFEGAVHVLLEIRSRFATGKIVKIGARVRQGTPTSV